MGASTAYHLARAGAGSVVLVEREPSLGAMSTGQCAGGIRHQFSSRVNIELSKHSIAMLERFEDELDQDIALRFTGYLFLMTDEKDVEEAKDHVALQRSLGINTDWLEPSDLKERVPSVKLDGVLAGTSYEKDGLCDPNSVVQGYATAARRLGARVLPATEVTDIATTGDAVTSVVTDKGEIATRVVVNAAGAWAPQIGAMVGAEIPIEPSRRQIVVTTETPSLPKDFPFVLFLKEQLYFHPEGPGVLTGKSNRHEAPGYNLEVDPEWEMVHLSEAMERLPLLENAGVLSRWAGLYEITPDAHPIFGRIPQAEGMHVMAGFSGHGFMHGPICGQLMAEEVLEGAPRTVDVSEFAYERFLSGELHPEKNVI